MTENTTETRHATAVRGAYLHPLGHDGTGLRGEAHIVKCDDCLAVLNSGHRYYADRSGHPGYGNLHLAQALADYHNREEHERLAEPVAAEDADEQPVTITLTLTEEEHLSLSAILFRAHLAYASDAHTFEQRVGTADDEPNHGEAAKNARWASDQSQAATAFAERISAKFRTAAGEAIGALPAPIGEELGETAQPQVEVVETARSKYAGTVRHNYCTLPTEDVEILPEIRHCADCGDVVERVSRTVAASGHRHEVSAWIHSGAEVVVTDVYPYLHEIGDHDHHARVRSACRYCNTDDPAHVQFVQASYSDETRCTRCGGVDGFAIGD